MCSTQFSILALGMWLHGGAPAQHVCAWALIKKIETFSESNYAAVSLKSSNEAITGGKAS